MKKREDLLDKTYKKLLEVGFGNSPLEDSPEFIASDVMGYGTALDEKIMSYCDFEDLIKAQRKQADNFDEFTYKSNPVLKKLFNKRNSALVVDEIDLTSVINDEKNMMTVRMSTMLEYQNDSWVIVHWHGSVADHISDGEDPWHVEEWKQRTAKLEKMVEEKTKELVEKNNELEIEASLERVRAVAMGMHKSDDLLNICEISFKELQKLGFDNLRNAVIHIPDDEQKYFIDYDFSDFTGGQIGKVEYGSHPIVDEYLAKIRSAEDAFFEVVIAEDMLEDWNEFRRKSGQMNDQRLDEADALYYYLFSIGIGDIGISTFKPINNFQIKILKRFRNVFDLAYRRYVDISLAEAQAKEAHIEAALERIRSKAMSMHSSEDLSSTVGKFFKELKSLGVIPIRCGVGQIDETTRTTNLTTTTSSQIGKSFDVIGNVKQTGHPVLDGIYENWKLQKEYHPILKGEDIKAYYSIMNKQIKYPEYKEDIIQYGNMFYFKEGFIFAWTQNELLEDELQIFRRFSKVLSLTYRRYMDLKEAEAQAKEAQIEAALEKVRSIALGMRNSEEVGNVSDKFFNEFTKLSADILGCSIVVIDSDKDIMELWRARTNVVIKPFERSSFKDAMEVLKKNMPDWFPKFYNGLTEREDYLVKEMAVDERNQFLNSIVEQYNYSAEEKSKLLKSMPEKITAHFLFFDLGYFALVSKEKLDANNLSIAGRFVDVFNFAYTRFLDIKKAEEQAKEAQIEMSLEKVRNVALSLKKSDEMLDVAKVLYEQLLELGFTNIRNALIDIKNGDDDTFTDYDYSHEMSGTITQMSYHDDPTLEGQFKKMATTTNDFFELMLEGKELEDLKTMRIENGEDEDPRLENIDTLTYNLYSFGNGAIGISNFGLLSPEEKSILNRFSNVFTFAYKRYTDLVQAEHQAREAQIELSLERIRAQVTAMKESNELLDIVVTMRTEFVNLGYEAHYFWYMSYHPEIYEKAMTSGDGSKIGMVMTLPRHIHGDIKIISDWEISDEPTVVYAMDVDAAVDYVNKMITLGDFKQVDPNAPTLDDIRHIGGLTFVMARTNHGEIGYSLPGVVLNPPSEDLNILVRFAGVFDLAYKRFEDLKNSELRNREAIIELALERVRARTMAMQKSNELALTAAHLFAQLNELGITPYRCNIAIVDDKANNCELWSTTNSGNVIPTGSPIPLNEYPVLIEMFDGWKTQRTIHKIKLEGKSRLEWTKYISKYLPFDEYKKGNLDENEILNNIAYFYNFYFKQGFFTIHSTEELDDEQLKVIQRFAYVFEQTFTRFLDLVNAEKQNRIIEAENRRKTEELEEARQLQLAMLPKNVPQLPNLDIAVYMKTATEVGGDYYDFNVTKNGALTAVIGDATGHGMKAGTVVTITKSLFNMLASEEDIVKTFNRMSNVIKDMEFRQLSMCLQMLKIENNELTICSAAMPPVLIYRNNRAEVDELELRGMPLGSIKNFPYKTVQTKLHSGDTVLLMSDGFPELQNENKFMFGYERTKEEFLKTGRKNSEQIVEHLTHSVKEWLGSSMPDDDITFVVIKIK